MQEHPAGHLQACPGSDNKGSGGGQRHLKIHGSLRGDWDPVDIGQSLKPGALPTYVAVHSFWDGNDESDGAAADRAVPSLARVVEAVVSGTVA